MVHNRQRQLTRPHQRFAGSWRSGHLIGGKVSRKMQRNLPTDGTQPFYKSFDFLITVIKPRNQQRGHFHMTTADGGFHRLFYCIEPS